MAGHVINQRVVVIIADGDFPAIVPLFMAFSRLALQEFLHQYCGNAVLVHGFKVIVPHALVFIRLKQIKQVFQGSGVALKFL